MPRSVQGLWVMQSSVQVRQTGDFFSILCLGRTFPFLTGADNPRRETKTHRVKWFQVDQCGIYIYNSTYLLRCLCFDAPHSHIVTAVT